MLALLRWLPADAALWASMRGGTHYRGWTQVTELVASLFDATQAQTVLIARANTDKKKQGQIKNPPPYPRPAERGSSGAPSKRKPSFRLADLARH